MSYKSLKDLSHDPKLAEALGNMVVTWANAEIALIGAMARISGMDLNMAQAGYYRIPTFESRIKFILSLKEDWETEDFDKNAMSDAIERLSKLASTRNHWIHGDWCVSEKTETVIFNHRVPTNSPHRKKSIKAADVRNHCEAVSHRANALFDLLNWDSLVEP